MRSPRRLFVARLQLCLSTLVLLSTSLKTVSADLASTIFWSGAAGSSWNNPANWTPTRVPDASDVVEISGGSNMPVQLDVTATVNALRLGTNSGSSTQALVIAGVTLTLGSNSTVRANGVLHFNSGGLVTGPGLGVDGVMNWSGGTLRGTMTIAQGANLRFAGADNKIMGDFTAVTNFGSIVWSGGTILGETYSGPATFVNASNGMFQLAVDGAPFSRYYGYTSFDFLNQTGAILRKSGSAGVNNLQSLALTSAGTVDVQTGRIELDIAATTLNGAVVSGAGELRAVGGSMTINGALTLDGATLTHQAGSLVGVGTNATVRTLNEGSFQWHGGTLYGKLALATGLQTRLAQGDHWFADFAELVNDGTITWTAGNIMGSTYSGPATIRNRAGSLFLANGGPAMPRYYAYQPAFFIVENGAEMRKTDSGSTLSNWQLKNDGLASVQAGNWQWSAGGASSGAFTTLAAGTFSFNGGTHTLTNGVTLNGAGQFRLDGGQLDANGTVTFGSLGSLAVFELANGATLAGSNFVNAATFVWNNGWIGGVFTVAPGGVVNVTGPDNKWLHDFARFENRGLVNWTGPGPIIGHTFSGPASILNLSNGVFQLAADGVPFSRYYAYQPFFFVNSPGAQLRKTSAGTVLIQNVSPTIQGDLRIDAGLLELNAPTAILDGVRIRGAGRLHQVASTVTVDGQVTLDGVAYEFIGGDFTSGAAGARLRTVNGGLFDWQGGSIGGVLTVTNNARMRISGLAAKYMADYAECHNYGTITFAEGQVTGHGYSVPATIRNHAGGRFVVATNATLGNYYNYQDCYFINDGTVAIGLPGAQWTGQSWRFTQSASGSIELQIAGTNAPAELGRLAFDRPVALGGFVRGSLAKGFSPVAGQRFTFLTASSLSGDITAGVLPSLGNGLAWSVDQNTVSVSLLVESNSVCAPRPEGLIAWYPGENSAYDVLGAHSGTLLGTPAFVAGKVGRAFRLNGTDSSVDLGPWFNRQTFSFALWVKEGDSQQAYADIFDNNHTGSRSFAMQWANSGHTYGFGGGFPGVNFFDLTPGVWQHVVVTREPGYITCVYVDGQMMQSVTNSGDIPYDGSEFLRLSAWGGGGRQWNGQLDEFQIYNRGLSAAEVTALHSSGRAGLCNDDLAIPTCLPQPSGLIGWWPGDNTTNDLTGISGTATLLNGAGFGPGLSAQAFNLDGGDDLISVGNIPGLQSATELTLMAWVLKAPGADNIGGIIGKWDSSPNPTQNSFLLFNGEDDYISRGGLALQFADGSAALLKGTNALPVGNWVHLAATWRASDGLTRLYKNGMLEAQTNQGAGQVLQYHTAFPARLGEWGPNTRPNSHWRGSIDEAMIFNRALNSNEVAAIVRSGPEGLCRLSLPDLLMRNVSAPTNAAIGQPIQISFTITNQGSIGATGAWQNAVLLAPNPGGIGADTIASLSYTGALPVNASVTLTQTVILPGTIFGQRYIGVTVDSSGGIAELIETNNTTFITSAIAIAAADLIPGSLNAPASAQFGQSIPVQFNVTNIGGATASSSWNDEIYLSPSATSLAGATLLNSVAGSSPLAIGTRYSRALNAALPLTSSSTPGTLFIVVVANANNVQVESDGANNVIAVPIALTLPPLPDLVVDRVQAPAFALPNRNLTLIWTVTNSGNAAAVGPWTEIIGLSNAANGAITLGEFRLTNVLSPGQFLQRTQSVFVPNSMPAGDWNVFATTDANGEIVEASDVNNATLATNLATVPALLTLDAPATLLTESDLPIHATVTRNGDRSASLVVTVTNSSAADLAMTNSVTIPAGASSASFPLTPIHDHIVDGNHLVVFGVTNADYQGASFAITIVDIDVPTLTLTFGGSNVMEGMTVPCTVTRDYATNRELVVVLNAGDSTQLTPPTAVTIPSNQLAYIFAVLAVDNNVVEPTRTNALIASAAGFQSTTASIVTLDNDLPTVTLRVAAQTVSEGAGPQATVATVTRTPISPRGLRLELLNSDESSAQVPANIVIPGGQDSASFPVAAIDNQTVDGTRTVSLRVFVLDVSGNAIAEGSGDTLQVLDDDGPTLKLTIDRDAVPEGQASAATATMTRNTATNVPLTISLATSATGELTAPPTVIMPAGASSVPVTLSSVLDGVSDGNKSVTVTASAGGFTPGSAVIVVTDIDMPDLVVRNVTTPTNGITDANFAITYRIENRGVASCTSNFVTRIFLSSDAVPGSDDRLLSEFPFEGTLAVGQFIEQTAQYALPGRSGRYWIIIVTDAANQVPEVLENNNTFVAALPIVVSPAYTATVQTDLTTAPAGTPVVMTGTATRASGGVMENAAVNIHIVVRGTRRIVPVQTDATGHFMLTWAPLANEAGNYQIGAAHTGEEIAPAQDAFTLIGIKLAPPVSELTVTEGLSITGHLSVVNLGETTLSGLSAQVVSAPANLSVTATLAANSLAGDDATDLAVVITANSATIPFGEVRVRVTAPGGVSAEAIYGVHVSALHPHLVAVPDSLYSIMIGGKQTSVEFNVVNDGGVATGPLTISVPVAPWLAVSSVNPMPAMPPGTTNRVTLLLTPSVDLPLGPYRNSAVISDGFSAGVSVPFEFLNVSEGKGHLRVSVLDEYTYYAVGGPKVTNATVTVRDAISQAVLTNGVTGASGEIVFTNLTEAYYQIDVAADKHSTFSGTILLRGGRTNDFDAFLSRETVQYHWSVVPATIEDRTRITLTTEFETFVPIPVVTIDPPLIDMKDFSGSVTQINLIIRNHGLVAAQDFVFDLPQHPDFEFTSLVNELGPIPAMTTISVPLTIRRIGGGGGGAMAATRVAKAASGSSGPCSVSAGGCWQLPCGGRKNKHCTPVAIINIGNCTPPVPPGGGSSTGGHSVPPVWVGFPNGAVGGGQYTILNTPGPFVPPFTFEPPKICDCDPDDFDDKCLKIPLSSSLLNSALDALSSKLNGLRFVSDVKIETEANVEICICCSKPEGLGAKLSGGGSITFKGKATFPMGGFPITKTISRGGFDFEVTGNFGCVYEQAFEFQASVNGKTECQFKNPTVDGSLSVDLPATFGCSANVHVVVRQNGQQVGELDVGPTAQVTYGLSGSVKYHKDDNSSSLTGEICGKGLKVHMGIPVKIPGIIDTDLPYDETLVEENCGSFSGGPSAAILARAETTYQQGVKEMQQLIATEMATATTAKSAADATSTASAEEGVCAKVTLQLNQDVVMARNAFNATLELVNNSPLSGLSNITVTIAIENEFGDTVNEVFGVRAPVLKGLTGVDGHGAIAPNATGSASWILVPTSEAAPFGPTRYGIGGVLSYWQDGNTITIPLFSAPITVFPDPRLSVKYFHQRDVFADDPFTRDIVEPTVPFNLAVMVNNRGRGPARDVKIVSGQPEIVENEKGLLIHFEIIGSQVEGSGQTPSLTATLGEIAPGTNRIALWLMTSTLQGLFTGYEATFMHQDSLGKTNLSLIDEVSIHEMIHLVQAPGVFEDGRPDFLVNDVRDADDLPDTLYLSGGQTNHVDVVREATTDGTPTDSDLIVHLSASVPAGWVYLRVPEPSDGNLVLTHVVRSDGVEISLGTNAWTTDRVFIGQGQRPVYTNHLHLLDHNSSGQWTLYYAPLPEPDTATPSSTIAALPSSSYAQIPVNWAGADEEAGSGIAFFDVYVSEDGGAFTPWLQHTMANGGVYFGVQGHSYAFYSVATDTAGNRESAPASPDAQTTVDRVNVAPTIAVTSSVTMNEGDTLILTPIANDADLDQSLTFSLGAGAPSGVLLNSANGQITWVTGEGNGPSTNQVRIIVSDNGVPTLSATGSVSIVVNEVNRPPTIAPLASRTVNELQALSVVVAVSDSDLPAQALSYSLGAGAPNGAAINVAGVFSWTPNENQGPNTNQISIIVSDSGTPSLSATQLLTVVVRDSRPDFVVSVGGTNLLAGESGHVPMNMTSGLDLTNVAMVLHLDSTTLSNLTLTAARASVASATLTPIDGHNYAVRLWAVNGDVLQGVGEFARLAFSTGTNATSAVVRLQPQNVVGTRSSGQVITNGGGVLGQILVVGREPILSVNSSAPRVLDVFMRPGISFTVEYSTSVTGAWHSLGTFVNPNAARTPVTATNVDEVIFYRARSE